MIASRLKFRSVLRQGSVFLGLVGIPLALSLSVSAQEAAPEPDAPAAEAPAEIAPLETATTETPVRPYLGARPTMPRHKGPSVGKARSILPEPYVTPGSVTVPDLPERLGAVSPEDPEAGQIDAGTSLPNCDVTDDGQDQTTEAPLESLVQDPFESGALEDLDPSLEAVTGAEQVDAATAMPDRFWSGYTHMSAAKRLMDLRDLVQRPSARAALRSLALGAFDLSAPADAAATMQLLKARLALLEAAGDRAGYQTLLADLPADQDWTTLEFERARSALYQGDLVTACDLATRARGRNTDPFWLKIGIMCAAARADRSGVDFQLGILEEAGPVPTGFYELSDLILVEAEQGSAVASALSAPLPLDSLSVAMARLSGAKVDSVDLASASPMGIDAALTLPALSEPARADLVQAALNRTAVDADRLTGMVRSLVVTDEDRAALFINAETDPSFAVDLKLLNLIGDGTQPLVDRQSAFRSVWARGQTTGVLPGLSPVLMALTQDMPRAGDAFDALRLRAALMAKAELETRRLFAGMRATGTPDKAARAHALIAGVPLLGIAGADSDLTLTADLIRRWIENRETVALSALVAKPGQSQIMLAVLEGLGSDIATEHWIAVQSDALEGAAAADPVAWRSLIAARQANDQPAMMVAALQLLSSGQALSLSPSMISSALYTLSDGGQRSFAEELALELVLEAGL